MNSKGVIEKLNLEAHIEGGYFRRTYQSPNQHNNRLFMSVIYYMLTSDSPVNHWHLNKSDIMHFHLQGASIKVFLICPDGRL